MRINIPYSNNEEGERRILRGFVWIPKVLPLDEGPYQPSQKRWLETASILQEWSIWGGWQDICWIEGVKL